MEVVLRLDTKHQLGEGIVWIEDAAAQMGAFFCVDIHDRNIVSFGVDSASCRIWEAPERVGWIIPTAVTGLYLAGFQSGFALLGLGDGVDVLKVTPAFPDRPFMRLNDACADCNGVVWAGSLNCDDETSSDGELFRYSADDRLIAVDTDYCVANGPAISPDNRLFLHTDSGRRIIYAFDFDATYSALQNKRIWRSFDVAEGSPDGMCFDAAGNLWVAHWGAGLVSQFAPTGALLQRVRLPVSNVTNLAFGGPHLDRLFVTTASVGLDAETLSQERLAGGIFEIVGHDSTGLPTRRFGSRQDRPNSLPPSASLVTDSTTPIVKRQ